MRQQQSNNLSSLLNDASKSFNKKNHIAPPVKLLFDAIQRGDLQKVKKIINTRKKPIHFDWQLSQGYTVGYRALELAYFRTPPRLGVAKFLLANKKLKININEKYYGQALLHHLCLIENLPALEDFVKIPGVNINLQNADGRTALHLACLMGNLRMVELLINANAQLNIKDMTKSFAIDLAIERGHSSVVDFLKNYASKNTKSANEPLLKTQNAEQQKQPEQSILTEQKAADEFAQNTSNQLKIKSDIQSAYLDHQSHEAKTSEDERANSSQSEMEDAESQGLSGSSGEESGSAISETNSSASNSPANTSSPELQRQPPACEDSDDSFSDFIANNAGSLFQENDQMFMDNVLAIKPYESKEEFCDTQPELNSIDAYIVNCRFFIANDPVTRSIRSYLRFDSIKFQTPSSVEEYCLKTGLENLDQVSSRNYAEKSNKNNLYSNTFSLWHTIFAERPKSLKTFDLHLAAEKGNMKLVKLLCDDAYVEIGGLDSVGRTPLHYATIHGQYNMAIFLGGICPVSIVVKDKAGLTPLQYAFNKQFTKIYDGLQEIYSRNLSQDMQDEKDLEMHCQFLTSEP